ncbi:unnamed protein product, partial [Scytosiphon promiscuus]
MVAWIKLDGSAPARRLATTARIGKRSTVACAAVALLSPPGAMSFLRAAGLGGGGGVGGGFGLRTTARGFQAHAHSRAQSSGRPAGGGGYMQPR